MPFTPPQQRGPPPFFPGASRRGLRRRPRAFAQEESPNSSASPSFPSTSRSSASPTTPSQPIRQQPVVLRFHDLSGSEDVEGGSEIVRERGNRGDERRGGRDPEGGERGDEGGRS